MFKFGKRKFEKKLLQPTSGVLSGMWFSNPHIGIETSLFFKIEIGLAPFEYNKEIEETKVSLDFIELPVASYLELANQSFSFPINPAEGYIDGSVYISNMHNPFDVTQIHFGSIENNAIEAEFHALLSFEDNSIKTTELSISTRLEFDNITIHCEKLSAMTSDEIQEFIKDKLDLNFYVYDNENKILKYKG